MNKRFYVGLMASSMILAIGGRLHAQPTILQQPLSVLNQLLGSSVSLCVGAQSSASTNLSYQWLRNGVRIVGATNSCLPMNSIQAADCGAFSVLVDDGFGVTVSEPADLTVGGIDILQGIDSLIDALDLINTNGIIRSDNFHAVKQNGTPEIIPGDPGGSEVWFKWSVPTLQRSGIVTFNTLGSDFDTTMAAYTGSAPTDLTPVPSAISDDDAAGYLNSQVSFYAEYGTTYLIAVDGFYGAQGNVVLSWTLYPGAPQVPSANPMPRSITASNGATVTLNSPWPGNSGDWFLNGSRVASHVRVLTITNLGPATVGSYVARFSQAHGVGVSAEPTQVQINTLQDGSTSSNSSACIKYMNAANSAFAQPGPAKTGARKLGGGDSGGFSCSQIFSTAGNLEEPGEPVVCNQSGAHPGWFSYVTPASGTLLISTAGSSFNTILGVFVGPGNSFSTLTNVGCGYTTNYQLNGQPAVYIPDVPAGQTNYIVVEGVNGASGTVNLNILCANPVTISSPPQSQSAGPGTNIYLAVSASGSVPRNYAWQFNGTNIPGATNGTLSISNLQAFQAGSYTVVISNSVSVVSAQAVVSYVVPPTITTQPASQTVTSNTMATLNVCASGSPAPVFQWLLNGTPAGSNSNALCIPAFQPTNQGTYTVIISNALGTVTSTPALLVLDGPCRVNSYCLSKGAFSLQMAGPAGVHYVIETSIDLVNWIPISSNNAPNGILNFTDTNTGVQPYRFYRGITNAP